MICDIPNLISDIRGISVSKGATLGAFIAAGMYMQIVDESDIGVMYGTIAYTIYICLNIYRTVRDITKLVWMAIRQVNYKNAIIAPCENMKLALLRQTKNNIFNDMAQVVQELIQLYNVYKDYEEGSNEKIAMAVDIENLLDKFDKLNIQHNITQELIDEESQQEFHFYIDHYITLYSNHDEYY